MRTRGKERGFFLQEAILLGLLLLLAAGAMVLYEKAAYAQLQDGCRMQALFMAREELANIEAMADDGRLSTGEYDWLSESERLTSDQGRFSVKANVTSLEQAGAYHVTVVAAWKNLHSDGKISLEREVYRHER